MKTLRRRRLGPAAIAAIAGKSDQPQPGNQRVGAGFRDHADVDEATTPTPTINGENAPPTFLSARVLTSVRRH